MPGRTTGKRKCKETITQVRERLTREQANRTKKRQKELLDLKESESDSEDDKSNSSEEDSDSPSLLRRDLYLSLLCLLILIVLLALWVVNTFQRRLVYL